MSGLAGRRVLVTRAADRGGELAALLESAGAVAVPFPTLVIAPPADEPAARATLATAGTFDWIVFTSVNGVRAACGSYGLTPGGARLAAVGPSTAAALAEHGLPVNAVPREFRGARIPAALGDLHGRRVLLPRGQLAGAELPAALRSAGAEVVEVTVYRTLPAALGDEHRRALAAGFEAVTFTSGSTVRHFAALVGDAPRVVGDAIVACIGPVTAAAARGAGLTPRVEPAAYTAPALAEALAAWWNVGAAAQLR